MKKIFIDTNVWLRFFLRDENEQFKHVKKLISDVEAGKYRPYTSSVVMLEIAYILKSLYKLEHEEVVEVIETINSVRGITIVDKTNFDLAFLYFRKYKVKFTDCLIVSQLSVDMNLVSYDEEFSKIKKLRAFRPEELLVG